MLKVASFVLDCDRQASLKIPQTLCKRGAVTLAIAVLILFFILSNDLGRGGTNTLPFSFQLAHFHFKRTSTLTRLAPSRYVMARQKVTFISNSSF